MELQECFDVFIRQDDWANINRYIGDFVDRNPKMGEVDEFFMAFRAAVIKNQVTPEILMANLDEKADKALASFTHWKMQQMNPLGRLIQALAGGIPQNEVPEGAMIIDNHVVDVDGGCQQCEEQPTCELYAEAVRRRASTQTAQATKITIQ